MSGLRGPSGTETITITPGIAMPSGLNLEVNAEVEAERARRELFDLFDSDPKEYFRRYDAMDDDEQANYDRWEDICQAVLAENAQADTARRGLPAWDRLFWLQQSVDSQAAFRYYANFMTPDERRIYYSWARSYQVGMSVLLGSWVSPDADPERNQRYWQACQALPEKDKLNYIHWSLRTLTELALQEQGGAINALYDIWLNHRPLWDRFLADTARSAPANLALTMSLQDRLEARRASDKASFDTYRRLSELAQAPMDVPADEIN